MSPKPKPFLISLPLKALSLNTAYPSNKFGRRYLTQEGKDYKEAIGYLIKSKYKNKVNEDSKFIVFIDFYFADNRRRDIDDYFKLLLDAVSGIIWADDSQIWVLGGTKHHKSKNYEIALDIRKIIN